MKKICVVKETGGGRLGGHFIENSFVGLPGVQMTAFADSNQNREEEHCLPGIGKQYDDYREMVEKERPDILVLASRSPEEHVEQIDFAIDHNCHVLTEKPLFADLIQGDRLIKKAHQNGIRIAVAHLARFAPVFTEMKAMISQGEIGRIITCYLRGKEDHRGGGEDMMVLGTHLLDFAVFLFGVPQEVFADVRIAGRRITSDDIIETTEPLGPTAGDEVMAMYHYPEGTRAIFESRRGLVEKSVCTRMGIVVAGTTGSLAVRFDGNRSLRISRGFPMPGEDEASYEEVTVPMAPEIPGAEAMDYSKCVIDPDNAGFRYYADNNRRVAWDLLCAIEQGTPLRSSACDALGSLEMIVGAYRSAIEGRALELPLKKREHPLG